MAAAVNENTHDAIRVFPECSACEARRQALAHVVRAAPLARIVCHCLDCQHFTRAGFSDDCVFYAKDLRLDEGDGLLFYQAAGSRLRRAKCATCSRPVYSEWRLFGFGLRFLPSAYLQGLVELPSISCEVFCHRRREVASSNPAAKPAISGAIASTIVTSVLLIRAMLARVWRR